MAVLEVRRHTMRTKPGQHLSQEGVTLARRVGNDAGPFSLVVSSPLPRAIETAIAMGFAVDSIIDALGQDLPEKLFSLIAWPQPIAEMAKLVRDNEECASYAQGQASHWRAVMEQTPSGQQALVVTHGAIIELGAIGLMPDADHKSWGGPVGYCEGFKFTADSGTLSCQVLRMPEEHQIIEN